MTVRNKNKIDLKQLHAAQLAWLEAEFVARAAFALVRLDSLDRLASQLTADDCFDSAFAIWDDYIDGRRADERGEKLDTVQLREQASIFARLLPYLPPKELFPLALAAWGSETFEVFTRTPGGTLTGKLGWYRGAALNVRTHPAESSHDSILIVWPEQGRIVHETSTVAGFQRDRIGLHPVFGRADS